MATAEIVIARSGKILAIFFAILLMQDVGAVYQESACAQLDGQCQSTGANCCLNNNYVSNKCPTQPNDVKCCLSVKPDGAYAEQQCTSLGGQCMLTSSPCCTTGNYVSGKCPTQPWNVKCCLPDSGCRLMDYGYSGTQFYHASQTSARIDTDFKPVMDTLNGYAASCNVKIFVTSSFRMNPVQATTSCHMIGHAIDMNVLDLSTNRLCMRSTGCLQSYYPSGPNDATNCFLQKVKADSALRWGASFSPVDPVHIDDGICANNPNLWEEIRTDILANCDE